MTEDDDRKFERMVARNADDIRSYILRRSFWRMVSHIALGLTVTALGVVALIWIARWSHV